MSQFLINLFAVFAFSIAAGVGLAIGAAAVLGYFLAIGGFFK